MTSLDQIVFVTGANGGMGDSMMHAYAQSGATVIGADRTGRACRPAPRQPRIWCGSPYGSEGWGFESLRARKVALTRWLAGRPGCGRQIARKRGANHACSCQSTSQRAHRSGLDPLILAVSLFTLRA